MANINVVVKAQKAKSKTIIAASRRYPSTRRMESGKANLIDKDKALFDFLDEKSNRL